MKILIISREFPPNKIGGTATVALNTYKGLISLGHSVKVVTTSSFEFNYNPDIYDMKCEKIYRTSKGISVEFFRLISSVINKFDPDCIIVPDIISYPESYLASKRFKKPIILICLQDFKTQSQFYKTNHYVTNGLYGDKQDLIAFEKSVLAKSQHTVFISNAQRRDMRNITLNNSRVIHLGVDFDEIKNIKKTVSDKESYLISTCARLVPEKGVAYIIKSMPKILKSMPEVRLSIIGVGPEEPNLRNLTKKLEIDSVVKFHGDISREESLGIMKKSKVGVVTSLWESFCYVAAEYMALETSLVTTDVKSLKEICPKEFVSSLSPDMLKSEIIDVDLLADMIIYRLRLQNTHDVQAASEYIRANFSNIKYAMKLENFIKEIAK